MEARTQKLQEWVQVRCAQWMMRTVFTAIRLELKTSVNDMNVSRVYCNRL